VKRAVSLAGDALGGFLALLFANFFHAMIPTPVIANDKRTRLDRVFVLYRTARDVAVRTIDVFDGQTPIRRFNLTDGFGDKTQALPFLEGENSFKIRESGENPEVFFGIGISIGVEFGVRGVHPTPGEAPTIQFVSAGADFFY
jgi:hypothetical protein